MRKLLTSFTAIYIFLNLFAVAEAHSVLIKRPVTNLAEQTRPVANFSAVAAAGAFNVVIKIGTTESLRLEGDDDLLNKIETVVENGTLKIRTQKGLENHRLNFDRVKVYVTAKALNAITLSGSGNMQLLDPVKAEAFSTTLSGSGNLETATIETGKLSTQLSGSGNITTAGKAREVNVRVSGSGNFDGRKFTAQTADVRMSGSGNVSIEANETLNGTLSGSGRIYYSGNAKVTEVKSGSGQIIKR